MSAMEFDYLLNGLEILNLTIDHDQAQKLLDYLDMVRMANQQFNLTAIVEGREMVEKHLIDSLVLLKYQEINNLSLLDIGTGAGFPGIPLAVCSSARVDLLESAAKKCIFLQEVCTKLMLLETNVLNFRAEELGKTEQYREKFDLVTSRAVASLRVLLEYTLPFLKLGGLFFAYKGPNIGEEIEQAGQAMKTLGGSLAEVIVFKLPYSGIERNLVVIKKDAATPSKYPRRSGMPLKRPL